MKALAPILAAVALAVAALAPIPARAAMPAFLVSCEQSQSVTGKLIYIGTYSVGGGHIRQSFYSYCPQTIYVD